jgi:hypothetical protein
LLGLGPYCEQKSNLKLIGRQVKVFTMKALQGEAVKVRRMLFEVATYNAARDCTGGAYCDGRNPSTGREDAVQLRQ